MGKTYIKGTNKPRTQENKTNVRKFDKTQRARRERRREKMELR